MKRLKLIIILLLMLSLTGCIQKSEVTDEQSDAIAEYVAGAVLNHDKEYDQELISSEELGVGTVENITDIPSPTDTSGNTSDTQGNDLNTSDDTFSLTEILNAPNFQIDYKSYKFTEAYSDEYTELNARENYKLMVLSFEITNLSEKKQKLNLLKDTDIEYYLYADSEAEYYERLLTFLKNDLKYIKMNFGAGENKEGLLIFEVPVDTSVSNVKLVVTNNDKSTTIGLNKKK